MKCFLYIIFDFGVYLTPVFRYTVTLRQSSSELEMKGIFDALEQMRWIDERTRAIFIEFSLYNAQVTMNAVCVICFFHIISCTNI